MDEYQRNISINDNSSNVDGLARKKILRAFVCGMVQECSPGVQEVACPKDKFKALRMCDGAILIGVNKFPKYEKINNVSCILWVVAGNEFEDVC